MHVGSGADGNVEPDAARVDFERQKSELFILARELVAAGVLNPGEAGNWSYLIGAARADVEAEEDTELLERWIGCVHRAEYADAMLQPRHGGLRYSASSVAWAVTEWAAAGTVGNWVHAIVCQAARKVLERSRSDPGGITEAQAAAFAEMLVGTDLPVNVRSCTYSVKYSREGRRLWKETGTEWRVVLLVGEHDEYTVDLTAHAADGVPHVNSMRHTRIRELDTPYGPSDAVPETGG